MSKYTYLKTLTRAGLLVPEFHKVRSSSEIKNLHLSKHQRHFAVRSSADVEDGIDFSFAGIFDSYLNIPKCDLEYYTDKVIASSKKDVVIQYCNRIKRNPSDIKMDVIIQEFIPFEISGIAFQDSTTTIIECIYGLGEMLANGDMEPDQIRVDTFGRINYRPAHQQIMQLPNPNDVGLLTTDVHFLKQSMRKLSISMIKKLIEIVSCVRGLLNTNVDTEWGYYQNKIYLVQARPLTTQVPSLNLFENETSFLG